MTVSQAFKPKSLLAFTEGLFDYAGLYPPAALPIEDAVAEYVRILDSDDARLCGPFVVDPDRLPAVARAYHERTGEAVPVSLLAGTRRPLRDDIRQVAELPAAVRAQFRIDQIESRWPETSDSRPTAVLMEDLVTESARLSPERLFFEIDPGSWQVADVATATTAFGRGDQPRAGLKIRCGGPDPSAVPSVAHTGGFLRACSNAGAYFKATAGLHHAVRAWHDGFGGFQHGFFNVFAAACILKAHPGLDQLTLETILSDTVPHSFVFTNKALVWRHLSAPTAVVSQVRETGAMSIGSCSIAEPADELRQLTIGYHV